MPTVRAGRGGTHGGKEKEEEEEEEKELHLLKSRGPLLAGGEKEVGFGNRSIPRYCAMVTNTYCWTALWPPQGRHGTEISVRQIP